MILRIFNLFITGKPGGRIERSFSTFPDGAAYTVQENALMDECLMLKWVEEILKPWADDSPEHIRPLLILDSYCCHTTTSVHSAIEQLGVDLVHIPGGCTPLCQPVDVGINKPFKVRMQNKWEEYLVNNRGIEVRGRIPSPSREILSEWIIQSLMELSEDIVKNAWDSSEFSYFNHNYETGDEEFVSLCGEGADESDDHTGESDDDIFDGEEMADVLVFNA